MNTDHVLGIGGGLLSANVIADLAQYYLHCPANIAMDWATVSISAIAALYGLGRLLFFRPSAQPKG